MEEPAPLLRGVLFTPPSPPLHPYHAQWHDIAGC
jgi:hypothetical protein